MIKQLFILLLLIPSLCFGGVKYTAPGAVVKIIAHGTGTNRIGFFPDESGNAHNATIKAPVLTLDSSAILTATSWKDLFGFDYFRFVSRFYADSSGSSVRYFFFQTFADTTDQIQIRTLADDTVHVVYKGAGGDAERSHTTGWTIEQDKWHSMIVEIKAGDDQLRIWLDGVRETDATPGAISAWADDIPDKILIGNTPTLSDGLTGFMRWAGLAGTNVAITDADARAYHNSSRTWLDSVSMSGYWPLNEGTNATFLDRSGNDHPLKGTGISWTIAQVPETGVNADTRMGIATTTTGYVDLVTTDKVSQGMARTASNTSNDTTIIFVGNDFTGDFPVNTIVQSPADGTWHYILVSSFAGGDTTLTIEPSPATASTWDNQFIEAFKGQLQLLSEDAFAVCFYMLPSPLGVSFYDYVDGGRSTALRARMANVANELNFKWNSFVFVGVDVNHTWVTNTQHSFVAVFDNSGTGGIGTCYSWVGAANPLSSNYEQLYAANPEIIRLGLRIFDTAGGTTVSFGPFCIIKLSDITGGVDLEVREGVRDAWHDADMDWEVFFADLLSKFDAWTGPSNGNTITITYWKLLNVVPYGLEIDTDNIISRYTRVLTRGSALPAEGAATTTSDTENCTGIPLDRLGDSFKGSGLWMDEAHKIDFGDHNDFSFTDGNDLPFSGVVWSDLSQASVVQYLFRKSSEWDFTIETNGRLTITLRNGANDIYRYFDSGSDGTLRMYAFTYNGGESNTDLLLYRDGVAVGTGVGSSGSYTGMTNTANSLQVEAIVKAGFYNGQLYPGVLSANEVLSLFRNGPYR